MKKNNLQSNNSQAVLKYKGLNVNNIQFESSNQLHASQIQTLVSNQRNFFPKVISRKAYEGNRFQKTLRDDRILK